MAGGCSSTTPGRVRLHRHRREVHACRRRARRSTSSSSRRAIRWSSCASTRASRACRNCPPNGRSATCSRTARLSGPDEILSIPKTFREKKLPCDALIYLGTEFTPSGWNTRNGEFGWKPENFPDPKQMIDEMHAQHFKVVLHIVIEGRRMSGAVADPCTPANAVPSGRTPDDRWPEDRNAACYWPYHKPLYDLGIDGWWPDQGDGLDVASRLVRHRMYWEGSQQWRPERAAVRSASQRRRRHAALRRVSLVRRRPVAVGDAQDARADRRQHRTFRRSVLGHRHRRVRADRRNTPASCTSGGFSSARSARRFARTAGIGISSCRGAGTAATAGRRKPTAFARARGAEQPARRADPHASTSSCAIG